MKLTLKEIRRINALSEEKRKAEIERIYGFDPSLVGLRPRPPYWSIIDNDDRWSDCIKRGRLEIWTKDGGSNDVDFGANSFGNFVGSEDDGDVRRGYYYDPSN